MVRADSNNSISPNPSRRRFMTVAAAASAVSAGALAAAAMPPALPVFATDPVLALIEAHRQAVAVVDAIEAEQTRLFELGLPDLPHLMTPAASEELDIFVELLHAVPTTLGGITALLTHLDQVEKKDPWKFEDNYATPLIGSLATALSRIGVPA